jgi:hypothetical protein
VTIFHLSSIHVIHTPGLDRAKEKAKAERLAKEKAEAELKAQAEAE